MEARGVQRHLRGDGSHPAYIDQDYSAAVQTLNGQNGDLVVTLSSQLNGGNPSDGTVFTDTIHSSNADATLFGVTKTPENLHPGIRDRIAELLGRFYSPEDWKGNLQ